MKLKTLLLLVVTISSATMCFAGAPKTGGNYEFMSDVIDVAGSAQAAGGNYVMYQSIGQPAGNEILAGSTYEMVGGFMGVIDEEPPAIEFASPAASSSTSGSINVIGTAFDQSGTEWTLYYGPGSGPSIWSQLGSGVENVTGATLVSWDASALSGTYSLKIIATDDRGNTATGTVTFSVNNIATVSGTVPKFKWIMLSVPVHPSPADPLSMFGTGSDYKVYRRDLQAGSDPVLGSYRYPESLSAGDGFWIKAYYNDLPYSYSGGIADTTQDYAVQLYTGWNQVGMPFNRDFPWGQVKVRSDGTEYDLTTAAVMGLVSNTLYGYDSDLKSWTLNDTFYTMSPETGYDVRAYSDVELLFDPGVGTAGGLMKIVRPIFDSRIKISASSANAADLDNFIGMAAAAVDEYDILDAEEPPKTPDTKYLSLYFPGDTWSEHPGRYAADIRSLLRTVGETHNWPFTVETNDVNETVTLSWDSAALSTDRYSFTLINLDTGERIDMATQGSYTFVAAGGDVSETHFKIEIVKLESEQITKSITLSPGWNLISVPLETEITSALEQLGDDLPLLNMYQFFDNKFYPSDNADIQAGLGFWIHVAKNTEIDIVGISAESQISVPLRPGWNLIGNPYDTTIAWDDSITIKCGDTDYSLSEAVTAKITDGKLFEYDGTGYTRATSLQPWKGYFVKLSQSCDLKLIK